MRGTLLNQILVFSVLGSGLGIAFWTYLGDKKSLVNRLFSCFVLLIVLNIFSSYLFQLPRPVIYMFYWARSIWLTASLLIPVFYFFAIHFPRKVKGYLVLDVFFITLGVIFSFLSLFTDLLIKDISIKAWGNEILYGSGIAFFYIALIASIVTGFWIILKKYVQLSRLEKVKINFFISGIAIFVIANLIFGILFPALLNNSEYTSLGDYSAIFFLGFTAYAIMKHQLFNIKVIATETTVILLSFGLFVEIILSNNVTEGALKAIVWVLATYGGYALIKSVKAEIKQKEDLERLATKLDEANQHLEELDEAKDNFLSMASHELNTPIAAIMGYLSMIIEEKKCGKLDPLLAKYLNTIFASSQRLARLVKDLLNVSRIESNRIHIIYSEAQIEDVIEQSIAEVAIKAKEVGHKLTFKKPEHKLPKTWLDVPRIVEVMINLIGNAIKYTEPPGKIVVSCHADDDRIIVSVEDNGRGIPKDKYDHVFEKFTQVNVLTDQVKGTGLGMFISKNLIALHKGKLWFKSSVDKDDHGTTFYFSLPILKDKPFDPNEGEGALFQTRKPNAQERTANKTDSEKATAATTSITAAEVKCEIDKAEGKEPSSKDCKTDPTSQKLRGTSDPTSQKLRGTSDPTSQKLRGTSNPTSQKLRGTSTPIPTKDSPAAAPVKTPTDSKAKL